MTPRAVLMKTGLTPLNTARPVNTAHPKTTVYRARPMSCFSKLAQSTIKRPYQSRTTLTNKNSNQKVNTAKPKAVNTARPTSAVVNAVKANQVNAVKASTCWVWRPTKLNSASITFKRQNYIDARGRSKEANNVNMQSRMDGRACNIKQKCVINQTPRQLKRGQDTKIPQSSGPPEKVGDKAVHKELGDRMKRDATTVSSLEAE
ncbi:hypothetical protein Tco_1534405 [Tanacetum coccineum]